jgi:DNA-binding response OmpR family regulator
LDALPTALVVEDDYFIIRFVEDALKDGGFAFHSVASGEEAISLFQKENAKYQVLVTDINLFGATNGWEVARAAREKNPDFPVVYITGSETEEWSSEGVPNSILLAKPFAAAQLLTAISSLLIDQRRSINNDAHLTP